MAIAAAEEKSVGRELSPLIETELSSLLELWDSAGTRYAKGNGPKVGGQGSGIAPETSVVNLGAAKLEGTEAQLFPAIFLAPVSDGCTVLARLCGGAGGDDELVASFTGADNCALNAAAKLWAPEAELASGKKPASAFCPAFKVTSSMPPLILANAPATGMHVARQIHA